MKRLAIILAIIFTSITIWSQVPSTLEISKVYVRNNTAGTNERHFHTKYLAHIENGIIFIKEDGPNENVNPEFGPAGCILNRDEWGNKDRYEQMNASFLNSWLKDLSYFVPVNEWEPFSYKAVTGFENLCKDPAGRRVEAEILNKDDDYLISIKYSTMEFMLWGKKTNKSFIDPSWELSPYNLIEKGKTYRNDPDYTDEELIEFFDKIGNGKLILESIKTSFFSGNLFE